MKGLSLLAALVIMKRSLPLPVASAPARRLFFETPLVKSTRIRPLNDKTYLTKLPKDENILSSSHHCVVYWMQRDQRVQDNYAMLYANALAMDSGLQLKVVFALEKDAEQTLRHYKFLLSGLKQVERECRDNHNLPFYLLHGSPSITEQLLDFCSVHKVAAVVTDFSPLRRLRSRTEEMAASLSIPLVLIDAHNIVPMWVASDKLEYGARTIRPKISRLLPEYLIDFPPLVTSYPSTAISNCPKVEWDEILSTLHCNRAVDLNEEIDCQPGAEEAQKMLKSFIESRLKDYGEKRNDPNCNAISHLSPYFNFGQLSVQRAVLTVRQAKKYPSSSDSFVEEAVVRRELSDNFCYYNLNYDNLNGAYPWARETLEKHANDAREFVYSFEQFEGALTHDKLWNAAQRQVVRTGKLHGFMRMYWAKKILEWSASHEEALSIAILLNDRYALDGTDPNGYVGVMWSIAGVHDQGWGERPVFGKIRFMNYAGCKRKFDVKAFEQKYKA